MKSVELDEELYSIREVHYDEDDNIIGWTVDAMDPFGNTLEELKADIQRMLAACDRPILDEAELEKEIAARQEDLPDEVIDYGQVE